MITSLLKHYCCFLQLCWLRVKHSLSNLLPALIIYDFVSGSDFRLWLPALNLILTSTLDLIFALTLVTTLAPTLAPTLALTLAVTLASTLASTFALFVLDLGSELLLLCHQILIPGVI